MPSGEPIRKDYPEYPRVTVDENPVVSAGAVVSKDVAPNTIVGGVPAKTIRTLL